MNPTNSNSNLLKAMVKATGEMISVPMDAVNPAFKSKYATLESVLKILKPVLARNGLGFTQCPFDAFKLETVVYHDSGEQMGWIMEMKPTKDTPQAIGSNISYMRRYMLVSIFGLVGDPDDDGNHASTEPTVAEKIETAAVRNGWTARDVTALIKKEYKIDSLEKLDIDQQRAVYTCVTKQKPSGVL